MRMGILKYGHWRQCACMLGAVALSACGGDITAIAPSVPPPASYSDLQALSSAQHATWDPIAATDPTTLPVRGTANFAGVMHLRIETASAELALSGVLNLKSKFATDALTGSATGFSDPANSSFSGTLTISNGVLDRAANLGVSYTYGAVLGGNLSGAGDIFSINADFSGDFRGASYQATTGAIAGSASSSFGLGYLFGDFIAAQ
jgi:hypothetical protein